MAKGTVNKVILLGRIGIQPEVRYMPSGMAVMSLSLATNDGYKNKDTGQFVESTEWVCQAKLRQSSWTIQPR